MSGSRLQAPEPGSPSDTSAASGFAPDEIGAAAEAHGHVVGPFVAGDDQAGRVVDARIALDRGTGDALRGAAGGFRDEAGTAVAAGTAKRFVSGTDPEQLVIAGAAVEPVRRSPGADEPVCARAADRILDSAQVLVLGAGHDAGFEVDRDRTAGPLEGGDVM